MQGDKSIESLVKALGRGSVDAFDELYRRFRPKVDKVAGAILGENNSPTVSDLSQNIFLKVWERRTLIASTVSDFDSYLFRMTKNEALNYIQRRKPSYVGLDDSLPVLSYGADSSIEAKETKRSVNTVVQQMPPQRKQVFELSRKENLTYKEIAQKMKISTKTVERHLSMALKDIKKSIS